jgi:signal transduction histidine kinase
MGATIFHAGINAVRRRQRAEITRAFHDRLAGKLSAIAKAAQTGTSPSEERLAGIAQLAQTALRNLRLAISTADPDADTLDGLVGQILQEAEEALLPIGIRLRLDVPLEVPEHRVIPHVRERFILFVSEVLNNTVRHAEATAVLLSMRFDSGRLSVQIEDNGRGFSPERAEASQRGLANLREHAAALGGNLEIRSTPGQGTSVRLSIRIARS